VRAVGRYYDMHCHCHEMGNEELDRLFEELNSIVIVAVSEDVETLRRTLELAQSYGRIIPCSGLHPWTIRDRGVSGLEELLRATYRLDIPCIGEVGLDRKFVPAETWNGQLEAFRAFARLAAEIDGYVTIHSPGAWREALEVLVDVGVRKAMFHWYTGPTSLVAEITGMGYYISINPAVRIQKKHARIVEVAPLDWIVTESDGPYNYKGLRLNPLMIPDTLNLIAGIKRVDPGVVAEKVRWNCERLLYG